MNARKSGNDKTANSTNSPSRTSKGPDKQRSSDWTNDDGYISRSSTAADDTIKFSNDCTCKEHNEAIYKKWPHTDYVPSNKKAPFRDYEKRFISNNLLIDLASYEPTNLVQAAIDSFSGKIDTFDKLRQHQSVNEWKTWYKTRPKILRDDSRIDGSLGKFAGLMEDNNTSTVGKPAKKTAQRAASTQTTFNKDAEAKKAARSISNAILNYNFQIFNDIFFLGAIRNVTVVITNTLDIGILGDTRLPQWKETKDGEESKWSDMPFPTIYINVEAILIDFTAKKTIKRKQVEIERFDLVLGTLLHEMCHVFLMLFVCNGRLNTCKECGIWTGCKRNVCKLIHDANDGISGHGRAWHKLIKALEDNVPRILGVRTRFRTDDDLIRNEGLIPAADGGDDSGGDKNAEGSTKGNENGGGEKAKAQRTSKANSTSKSRKGTPPAPDRSGIPEAVTSPHGGPTGRNRGDTPSSRTESFNGTMSDFDDTTLIEGSGSPTAKPSATFPAVVPHPAKVSSAVDEPAPTSGPRTKDKQKAKSPAPAPTTPNKPSETCHHCGSILPSAFNTPPQSPSKYKPLYSPGGPGWRPSACDIIACWPEKDHQRIWSLTGRTGKFPKRDDEETGDDNDNDDDQDPPEVDNKNPKGAGVGGGRKRRTDDNNNNDDDDDGDGGGDADPPPEPPKSPKPAGKEPESDSRSKDGGGVTTAAVKSSKSSKKVQKNDVDATTATDSQKDNDAAKYVPKVSPKRKFPAIDSAAARSSKRLRGEAPN